MELTEKFTNSFQGIAVSPGIGIGRVMKLAGPGNVAPERLEISDEGIQGELERFRSALEATEEQLSALQKELRRKLNNLDADIFNAHLMMVHDRAFVTEVERRIQQEKCNAEYALHETLNHFQKVFCLLNQSKY